MLISISSVTHKAVADLVLELIPPACRDDLLSLLDWKVYFFASFIPVHVISQQKPFTIFE